jgi:hypothetical protein
VDSSSLVQAPQTLDDTPPPHQEYFWTTRSLTDVFANWDARNRIFTKVRWLKLSGFPEGVDANLVRTTGMAFDSIDRENTRVLCRDPASWGFPVARAVGAGNNPEIQGSELQRSAVGRSPERAATVEPELEIKVFPEALESVLGAMSLAN